MSLSRRSFLGGMLGIGAVAPIVSPARMPGYSFPGEVTVYDHWRVVWTGWKKAQNTDLMTGQWLAHRIDQNWSLYVVVPSGIGGKYQKGYVFDLSMREGRDFITQASNEKMQREAIERGRQELFAMMARYDEDANL